MSQGAAAGVYRRPVFNALQGLRGVAALLVMADHLLLTAVRRLGCPPAGESYAFLLGGTGIQMFFVISGFVMILAHGEDFGQPGAPATFASRRLSRIVPLYWLMTLFYWFKERLAGHVIPFGLVVLSLLFVPHQEPNMPFGRPAFPLGWTLEFEMAFYLVFTVSLALPRAIGLAVITGLMGGLCIAASLGAFAHSPLLSFYGDPIVLFFIGGVWVGMLGKMLAAFTWRWSFGAALSCALGLIAIEIALAALLTPEYVMRSPLNPIVCIGAVLVCALAREAPETGVAEAAAKTLGDATYSIYLTHTFVLGALSGLVAHYHFGTTILFAVTTPAVILFGVIVYRVIERPLVRAASQAAARLLARFDSPPPPASAIA